MRRSQRLFRDGPTTSSRVQFFTYRAYACIDGVHVSIVLAVCPLAAFIYMPNQLWRLERAASLTAIDSMGWIHTVSRTTYSMGSYVSMQGAIGYPHGCAAQRTTYQGSA